MRPDDIDVASIYDDYPTMVLAQADDLGFIPDHDLARFCRLAIGEQRVSGEHLGRHAVAPASPAARPAG